jgi:hypothetical protein
LGHRSDPHKNFKFLKIKNLKLTQKFKKIKNDGTITCSIHPVLGE